MRNESQFDTFFRYNVAFYDIGTNIKIKAITNTFKLQMFKFKILLYLG